jgi:hypothetical protein
VEVERRSERDRLLNDALKRKEVNGRLGAGLP